MSLIDFSGVTRGVSKLGNAVIMTVQPAANLLEIANDSSTAWTLSHAADLAAKTDRQNRVRQQEHANLLRKALASTAQKTIDINEFCREVEIAVDIDSFKERIHKARRKSISDIGDDTIQSLVRKSRLTDADILNAAKVGSMAPSAIMEEEQDTKPSFDINRFKAEPAVTV